MSTEKLVNLRDIQIPNFKKRWGTLQTVANQDSYERRNGWDEKLGEMREIEH